MSESLLRDLHRGFVKRVSEDADAFEFVVSEHLRMSGVYWGCSALALLGTLDDLDRTQIVDFVLSCAHESGGFGGNVGHDAHMLYTLSAVQILALFDALDRLDAPRTLAYVAALQKADGSFAGDEWGEVDTRFSYCALCCASLLGRLDTCAIDVAKAVAYVKSCENFDGGFGCVPGGESHAGQVFTCVGALAIAGALDVCQRDLLAWWLCERQTPGGGLNGRPQKEADVCYSWWVLSSLAIMGKMHWIDHKALARFILGCQDEKKGGIADRPDDEPDVYHTFFGLAALSLMGFPGIKPIDPVFALPTHVCERIGVMRTAADGTVIGRKEENSANTGGESGGESARP